MQHIIVITFSIFILISSAYAGNITEGLLGYWQFDAGETDGSDSMGNPALTAQFYNNAITEIQTSGFGRSLYLGGYDTSSGLGDYLVIDDPVDGSNRLFSFQDEYTLKMWVNYQDESASKIGKLFDKWPEQSSYGRNYTTTIYHDILWFHPSGIAVNISSDFFNQWHQVTFTFKKISTTTYLYEIYLDNDGYASSIQTTAIPEACDLPLMIGAGHTSPNNVPSNIYYYYQGYMDEIKIFDRALTQQEVYNDYAYGISLLYGSSETIPEPASILMLSLACIFFRSGQFLFSSTKNSK